MRRNERHGATKPGSSPRVSVVIPAYNRERSIRNAIDSVLGQSFADIEVIVVDDASTDGTRDVVAQITDSRLRVIVLPENRGAAAARNVGIDAARGSWVAFQDSDDEWLPSKLATQMARLDTLGSEYIAAYCGMLVLGFNDAADARDSRAARDIGYIPKRDVATIEGDLSEALLWGNFVSTQTLVVRRDAVDAIGPMNERLPALEDWEYAIRLARHGPITCIDDALVIQRLSANSLSRDFSGNVAARRMIVEDHADVFRRHPRALAQQYYTLAGGYRRMGDLEQARWALHRARTTRPSDLRLWSMTLLVTVMNVGRILRPRRHRSG